MPQTWRTPSSAKAPAIATGRTSTSATQTGRTVRRRHSLSSKDCSRSSVEPKASGESASARSRTSRSTAQSSGVSRRREGSPIRRYLQDAGGADVGEPHLAVDAGGVVGAGREQHGTDAPGADRLDECAGDRGAEPTAPGERKYGDPHQLRGIAAGRGAASARDPAVLVVRRHHHQMALFDELRVYADG